MTTVLGCLGDEEGVVAATARRPAQPHKLRGGYVAGSDVAVHVAASRGREVDDADSFASRGDRRQVLREDLGGVNFGRGAAVGEHDLRRHGALRHQCQQGLRREGAMTACDANGVAPLEGRQPLRGGVQLHDEH